MATQPKRMTAEEVGAVLAFVNTKLRFKVGIDKTPIDAMTVASWKEDFDAAHCGHYHIMIKAIGNYFRTEQAQYGVTPDALITAYKRLTRQIADKADGWELMNYDERQAILADPAQVAYVNGELTTSEYVEITSRNARQIAGQAHERSEQGAEAWRRAAIERGITDPATVGRISTKEKSA